MDSTHSHKNADSDDVFMLSALAQAAAVLEQGEFPVGCVIVQENRIISRGSRNGTIPEPDRRAIISEVDHAEIRALKNLESCPYPVMPEKCTLYCTLEPCLMCFGAIILTGIPRIVYAFEDPMGGGTACDLASLPLLYKDCRVQIKKGVCRRKSLDLFYNFFNKKGNQYWKNSFLEQYVRDQKQHGQGK
jgi:tRNA(adenine34) deaminase